MWNKWKKYVYLWIFVFIRVEDSGFYEFRIQNSYGISSTTASLTIAQSKIILSFLIFNFFKAITDYD